MANSLRRKKIFAVSDIHGYFDELQRALLKAKFDSNDSEHLLVVCGDIFDRGSKSKEVYHFLRELEKTNSVVVVKGNHDCIFLDFLLGKDINFHYKNNGLDTTITSLYMSFEEYVTEFNKPLEVYLIEARLHVLANYKGIVEWFMNMPYYFETKRYIFTHASIECSLKGGRDTAWRNPTHTHYSLSGWEALVWDDGSFFNKEITSTKKRVVIGHFGTRYLRVMYKLPSPNSHAILKRYDGRVIAIDGTTKVSGKVNVLKVGDILLKN